jgi:hypothetical protein
MHCEFLPSPLNVCNNGEKLEIHLITEHMDSKPALMRALLLIASLLLFGLLSSVTSAPIDAEFHRSTPEMSMLVITFLSSAPPPSVIETDSGRCVITFDQSKLSTADVAVMWWPSLRQLASDQPKRPEGALWIYYNLESPAYSWNRNEMFLQKLSGQINMMATYQQVSDIPVPYGYFFPRQEPLEFIDVEFRGRTKMLVTVTSNCGSPHRNKQIEV